MAILRKKIVRSKDPGYVKNPALVGMPTYKVPMEVPVYLAPMATMLEALSHKRICTMNVWYRYW